MRKNNRVELSLEEMEEVSGGFWEEAGEYASRQSFP